MADICVGIGFRAGAGGDDIVAAVRQLLASAKLDSDASLRCFCTLDRKASEPAVLGAAAVWGIPVLGFGAGDLARVTVPNPSNRVRAETGSPSVAEAAAVLGARGGPLIVTKSSGNGVAVAAARRVP
ncbi:cobalamin biosynthesis protein [Rhodococcus sp. WMMA185]|uniref:cobalamin biosynthesis protein n=1 Tax=Rhodococcus sp. WMMA185 TaxID=679318 RepID=UPI0008787D5F|nr:cobalamin biosynthesis protein [Rhodococcus sp. WMMA185]